MNKSDCCNAEVERIYLDSKLSKKVKKLNELTEIIQEDTTNQE
jgi:hypothetical protein